MFSASPQVVLIDCCSINSYNFGVLMGGNLVSFCCVIFLYCYFYV